MRSRSHRRDMPRPLRSASQPIRRIRALRAAPTPPLRTAWGGVDASAVGGPGPTSRLRPSAAAAAAAAAVAAAWAATATAAATRASSPARARRGVCSSQGTRVTKGGVRQRPRSQPSSTRRCVRPPPRIRSISNARELGACTHAQPVHSHARTRERCIEQALWRLGHTGAGIRVAIFDTGLGAAHPHLRNVEERTNWTDEETVEDAVGHGSFVAGCNPSCNPCLGGCNPVC